MIRNGTPRPPDTREGCLGAATTSPPAVMIRSFQEIPARLKARRSLGKDQHLCQLDPLSAQQLASLTPAMTPGRHIKMLPECRDHGVWRKYQHCRWAGRMLSGPQETPDFLGQVILGEGL